MAVTYFRTDDPEIPAVISANGQETPVWMQAFWKSGPDVKYIRRNGCGHCCAAMAARLNGVKEFDPGKEYARCLELWGEPSGAQDHFQTVKGIAAILNSLGVRAEALGVPGEEPEFLLLREHLEEALRSGKQVILWSHPLPGREQENPFSAGEHYVMACGYDTEGRIVIANSGIGVQLVSMDTVMEALYRGCEPERETWGEEACLEKCGGVVIAG